MVAHGERATPNGQELLAEFVQYGHQRPFEEIVRRYAGMVFNVCVRITKDKHEAEDATQAVFLTLALQAKRGTEIKALGPWLQQVAKRLSLDSRRSKKRRKTREERHQEEQTLRRESILGDTLPGADLDELKTVLHEELQKLPTKYRLPLILHYFGGLSRDEMAAELGCKPSTLGVRIFRGREMLAGRLSGRGINISAGALAMALGYTVQRAISDSLISSTSYAATAIAAGHDGAGLASAHVIGLTRRASSALVIGKVKIAGLTLLIAGTSLGASVKAMDLIPAIDVRQMISNQVQRLVRPLFGPFNSPLRVDAQTTAPTKTIASNDTKPAYEPLLIEAIPQSPVVAVVKPIIAPSVAPSVTPIAANSQPASVFRMPWNDAPAGRSDDSALPTGPTTDDHASGATAAASTDVAEACTTGAGGGGSGGAGSLADPAGLRRAPDTTALHASAPSLPTPVVIVDSNNLYVPPALGKSSSKASSSKSSSGSSSSTASAVAAASTDAAAGSAATNEYDATTAAATTATASSAASSSTTASSAGTSPAAAAPASQIVQIPATNGSVIETNGTVRGYGIVHKTGIITMDGKVVADGYGDDRTLDLRSFAAIQKDISNDAAGGSNGWYAVDHGRLSLALLAGSNSSILTWGESPSDTTLDLVNSVRLVLQPGDGPVASCLSLLSPDRNDVPNLMGIDGAPVGLWQVDPSAGSIASADLTIRYNDTLIGQLGASESSVSLWTLSAATDSWSPVDSASFSLDTADHTVSGFAQDFSYFAVAVPPAPGEDVGYLIANPQAGLGVVPEPVGIIWITAAGVLLGRRRKSAGK